MSKIDKGNGSIKQDLSVELFKQGTPSKGGEEVWKSETIMIGEARVWVSMYVPVITSDKAAEPKAEAPKAPKPPKAIKPTNIRNAPTREIQAVLPAAKAEVPAVNTSKMLTDFLGALRGPNGDVMRAQLLAAVQAKSA